MKCCRRHHAVAHGLALKHAEYQYFVSERNPEHKNSMKGRTYSLYCNGAVGNMLYLTDLDYAASKGHNIAEVDIYGTGMEIIFFSRIKSKGLLQFCMTISAKEFQSTWVK